MPTDKLVDVSRPLEATVDVEHLLARESSFSEHPPVVTDTPATHAHPRRSLERLPDFFEQTCDRRPDEIAVVCGNSQYTYQELDCRANRLAHLLRERGVAQGQPVGILLERSLDSYVALLGVLKAGAAFVPFDPSFPADRVTFIAEDAGLRDFVTTSAFREKTQMLPCPVLELDEARAQLAAQPGIRPENRAEASSLCYIIYTSGTTGKPKGVAVSHANITNFLRVVAPIYDVRSHDRVYQGLSIAFDFSFEEIWPAWIAGATLVAGPTDVRLLGEELSEFLTEHKVTVLCCVPTLLATIETDVPSLRLLLVSGEACPADLVRRWSRPGRRMLNAYGPTETTVTATCCELLPDRPVTLGTPLPTYHVYILDEQLRPVEPGDSGEICIGGPGVAIGYLNRPDLTAQRFVSNPFSRDRAQAPRIYRTGDLGRFTASGEIEYHGRIDTQVKIRGYRIELGEIESVLLQVPGIAQAVVDTYEPEPGVVELVAYYSLRKDTVSVDQEYVYEQLRGRLPGYMIPAYLEELAVIPMLSSDKADRKNLPAPTRPRSLATQHSYVAPTTGAEQILADVLAQVMRLERVSVASHFFDDLGANSLLMTRFCARVRERGDLPGVSIKDVYLHPTIRSLAAALQDVAPAPAQSPVPASREAVARVSTWQYILCGALQFLIFLGYFYLITLVMDRGYAWVSAGTGLIDISVRSLVFGVASFVGLCTVPILAKWMLVGRWKPQEIPVWSLAYVRFWFVKTLIRTNPLVLFVGSPLYVLYLRALGAKIGRGVAIFSQNVPVCTDLLSIGDGTVIRKDAFFSCYRAHAGLIQMGSVTIGKDVFVGEATVLDIETSLGDGAQLGHSSSLHASQAVPAGERWHGSPAQRTDVNYRTVEPTDCSTLRRFSYSALQLLSVLVLYVLGIGVATMLLTEVPLLSKVPLLAGLLGSGSVAFTSGTFYLDALVISFVLFFGVELVGLALVITVPRVLNLVLRPGVVYPLYGFHYWVQRTIARMTNMKFFMELFGDSSYIVHYLRSLGYDLSRVEQTGTNFGIEQKHETPFLSSIGSGTMVSDGLSLINADFSSTSFRVSRASIGARNFLGNNITYPSQSRTGDNCLLATKVMIPIEGDIREDVGLLGSPCFEIPRSVQRDSRFDHLKSGDELRRGLAGKNQHNTVTMAAFLLVRWIHFFGVILLAMATTDLYLYDRLGAAVITGAMILTLLFSVAYFVLIERAVKGFRALRPQFCSIYDPTFWRHERFWKLCAATYVEALFNGTPFKNVIWRLLGVRIGSRVFDDGCAIPERTLVTIGNDSMLNAKSCIQCHSLEDGTFKSDRITLGAGCTVGTNAFVHYGVTIGDGAVLDADSFLMKGEEIAPHARWRGNPARELRDVSAVSPAAVTLTVTDLFSNTRTESYNGSGQELHSLVK